MVTSLSCACSSVDREKSWASCSIRVILFRNCHFQSFQRPSGICRKNLYLAVVILPGGSSSRSSETLSLPGGCSSGSLLPQPSRKHFSDSCAVWLLSFANDVFTLACFSSVTKMRNRFNWFLLVVYFILISFCSLSTVNSYNIQELLDQNSFPCYNLHVFSYMK